MMNRFALLSAASLWLIQYGATTLQAQSSSEAYADIPMFRPRTDSQAIDDTQALRERLSKVQDTLGPVNVLRDYVQKSSESKSSVGRDIESERKPTLDAKPDSYNSATSNVSSPDTSSRLGNIPKGKGILLLPGPRYSMQSTTPTNVKSASLAASDGFRPGRIFLDPEANVAPSLASPVSFASATVPANNLPPRVTTYYPVMQGGPEFPGRYGSVPDTSIAVPSVLPTAPPGFQPNVMPNATAPIMPPNAPFASQPPAFVNPPATPAPVAPTYYPPANTFAAPQPTFVNPVPGTMAPSVIGSPIGGTPMPNSTTAPLPMYNAPAPYYPGQPLAGQPLMGQPSAPMGNAVPMTSPSDNTLPRYPRQSPIVNGAPFVSGPPCQFDASYLVSPRAYRPNIDSCGPSTYAPSPYATRPNGSPFAYVPPTAMPPTFRSPPYPTILGFGQSLNSAYLSRGIIGQPTAYVDGQPIRNFLRYISP